jgi:hypothetical protein
MDTILNVEPTLRLVPAQVNDDETLELLQWLYRAQDYRRHRLACVCHVGKVCAGADELAVETGPPVVRGTLIPTQDH